MIECTGRHRLWAVEPVPVMARNSLNVALGAAGLAVGVASLLLAAGDALALLVLGLVLGVLLSPWVRRGCAWLLAYLSR